MIVEESIAKLGLKVGNLGDAKKFIKTLQDCRRALKNLDKGADINLGKGFAGTRGLRDIERMTAAMRRYRREADLAARAGAGGFGPRGPHPFYPGRPGRFSNRRDRGGGLHLDDAMAGARLGLSRAGAVGAGAYGAGMVGRRAIDSSMDFERAMIEVAKATDAKGAEREDYAQQIMRLARDTGKNKEDLAGMLAQAGFAGRPKDELMRFTEFGAKATTAWGMTPSETGESLAYIGNIYTANQAEIERIGDQINTMVDKSASKETDLLEIIRRTGQTGRTAGMTSGDILGIGAGLKERGVQTEIAASGMEAYISFLKLGEKYSKGADEGIKKLGLSSDKLRKNFVAKPTETLLDFLERIAKVTDPMKRAEVLDGIFGATRQDDVERMVGSVDSMRKNIAMMNDPAQYKGSVFAQFAEQMQNDVSKIDQATQQWDVLMKRLGDPGKRALGAGAERMNNFLDRVEAGEFKRMASPKKAADAMLDMIGRDNIGPKRMTRQQFEAKFGAEPLARSFLPGSIPSIPDVLKVGKGKNRSLMPGYKGIGQTSGLSPTFGAGNFSIPGLTSSGAEMAAKAMQQVTQNTYNTDSRTQSVVIHQTVNGVPGVASAAAEGAKSGLSSMGASVVKGNLTATGASAAP